MSAGEWQAELKGIDLAWWPEFLLNYQQETSDADSFTPSQGLWASAVAEEDSLC